MPVPKRQHSRARSKKRAAGKHKIPLIAGGCGNCGLVKQQHSVCLECGFYKGEKVLRTKTERSDERILARSAKRVKSKKSSTIDAEASVKSEKLAPGSEKK